MKARHDAPAPARWSRLAPCPDCGRAITVDANGRPVGEHVGSRLCRELAAEREPPATPEPKP